MGVKKLEDLVAFMLAVDFKRRIYRLVRSKPMAWADYRYRSQLFEAASSVEANIAEGWRRFSAGDMAQFLRIALASLEEAKRRLLDGVDRAYFGGAECAELVQIGKRCGAATMGLWKSLQPYTASARRRR